MLSAILASSSVDRPIDCSTTVYIVALVISSMAACCCALDSAASFASMLL